MSSPSDRWARRGLYAGLGLSALLVTWWALTHELADAVELADSAAHRTYVVARVVGFPVSLVLEWLWGQVPEADRWPFVILLGPPLNLALLGGVAGLIRERSSHHDAAGRQSVGPAFKYALLLAALLVFASLRIAPWAARAFPSSPELSRTAAVFALLLRVGAWINLASLLLAGLTRRRAAATIAQAGSALGCVGTAALGCLTAPLLLGGLLAVVGFAWLLVLALVGALQVGLFLLLRELLKRSAPPRSTAPSDHQGS